MAEHTIHKNFSIIKHKQLIIKCAIMIHALYLFFLELII